VIEGHIKRVMAQVLDIPAESIDDNTSPDTVENWDSLRHMNLVMALEEAFQITFTEGQLVEMLSYPLILETVREVKEA
jgi:acyl carrier protein